MGREIAVGSRQQLWAQMRLRAHFSWYSDVMADFRGQGDQGW